MNRSLVLLPLLASFMALSACGDGQPFTFGAETAENVGEDDTTPNGIPENIGRNVETVTGTAGDGTVDVLVTGLDGAPGPVAFARNPNLDVPGYVAYSYQDDPLDRLFVAMVQNSNDGALFGAAVIDGGQFTEYYGGVYYEQLTGYTPDTGQVSYSGAYVGLTNISIFGNELLPVPLDTPNGDRPRQPTRLEADIFLNANFEEGLINGAITGRELVDLDSDGDDSNGIQPISVPDVFLIGADVNDDGSFEGTVELGDNTGIGTYAGTFGGTQASSVAGGLFLDGDWWDQVDGENEIGLFVLTQCGEAGDDATCDLVN